MVLKPYTGLIVAVKTVATGVSMLTSYEIG